MNTNTQQDFWKNKSLSEMSHDEWESLCDGCGRCCLHKLEDEDNSDIYYTNVACRLLDLKTCRCMHYLERKTLVSDCLFLEPSNMRVFHWLPPTCAYRLLDEGKELPKWHPLVSGHQKSVHSSGISIRKFAIAEAEGLDLEDYIFDLPESGLTAID